jgi:hypothetical protein
MERALFDAVQQKLTDQWTAKTRVRSASNHLLTGLPFDEAGHRIAWRRRMRPRPASVIAIARRCHACMKGWIGYSRLVDICGRLRSLPGRGLSFKPSRPWSA